MTKRRAGAALATCLAVAAGAFAITTATTSGTARAIAGPSVATTVAGDGEPGVIVSGSPATSARLTSPGGIAIDSSGDLFVADTGACRVVEVPSRDGRQFGIRMTASRAYTIAGGTCGTSDVGFVSSVTFDPSTGGVVISDTSGNTVLELLASRRLVRVAGTGRQGDTGNGGEATAAELSGPQGTAVDRAGDVYIADTENCEVREVPARSGPEWGMPMVAGHIYVVAGTGECGENGVGGPVSAAQLWDPVSLAVGAAGDLLVSDAGSEDVLERSASTGSYYGQVVAPGRLVRVAGVGSYAPYLTDGLPATGDTAELNTPAQIALDARGDLFVADTDSGCIREVAAVNGVERSTTMTDGDMYTVAGEMMTGAGDQQTKWTRTQMVRPYGVAVAPDGSLYYSDQGTNGVGMLASRSIGQPIAISKP